MFQYWQGLITNKQLVGTLRQYYTTTIAKPTLEDVMRRASEYTACYYQACIIILSTGDVTSSSTASRP